MKSNLFIPKKMKAGFQNRKDTFTGKLSYIIYFDEKNKLRKEKSWLGWCNSEIDAVEFDNVPTSGFVINKDIQHYGSSFNYGRSMIRIYDPRGFEFEISVANLSLILCCCDTSKNEITGDLIYSIVGTELFLLPVNSQEYIDSNKFTKLINSKMSTRDLVVGKTYLYKDNNYSDYELIYLGYYNYNDYVIRNIDVLSCNNNKKKKHIYLQKKNTNNIVKEKYITENINKIYDSENDIDDNIDQLINSYLNSIYYKGISFKYEDIDIKEYFNCLLSTYKNEKENDKIPFFYKETNDFAIYLKGFISRDNYYSEIRNKLSIKTYIFYKEDIKDMPIVDYIKTNYGYEFSDFENNLDNFYYEYYKDSKIYHIQADYIINIRDFVRKELNIDNYLFPSAMFIYFTNNYSKVDKHRIETNDDQDKFFEYLNNEGFKKISLDKK